MIAVATYYSHYEVLLLKWNMLLEKRTGNEMKNALKVWCEASGWARTVTLGKSHTFSTFCFLICEMKGFYVLELRSAFQL